MSSYRKYTTCVKPRDHVPLGLALAGSTFVAALAAAGLMFTSVILVSVLIGLDLVAIAGAYWYLHGRLVCLGTQFTCTDASGNTAPLPDNQECAIGVIGAPGHPGIFRPRITGLNPSKFGDDDSTMDILLAPGPTTYEETDLSKYWNKPQGYLIAVNNDVIDAGMSYTLSGNELRYLHCEFEGSGIQDFLEWLLAILAILLALLAVQLLFPALTALVWLLSLLAVLLGVGELLTGAVDPGAPGDPTDAGGAGNLQAGDIVVVTGDWVYDSGHDGWNEIHAVHNCQRIAQIVKSTNADGKEIWLWPPDIGFGLGLDTPDKVNAARALWCCAIGGATRTQEGGSTTDPANNWIVHPMVDGCQQTTIF